MPRTSYSLILASAAAVIAVESPTATFQLNDFSMSNIVSAAIFGDGAACVLLSSHEDDEGPEILRKKCIFMKMSI
jgi:predicted naringenin-chalcone synthase